MFRASVIIGRTYAREREPVCVLLVRGVQAYIRVYAYVYTVVNIHACTKTERERGHVPTNTNDKILS